MINTERIKSTLSTISGLSAEEIENYDVLVKNSAAVVENALIDTSFEDDDRIIYLAATRAYYNLMLTGVNADDVSEFAAGDVKISLRSQPAESALKLYREAAEAAGSMVYDSGFVFRGV
ncbi:MAG: hypothetical protein E7571_01650 [Ruminococcaceae bacterium]|nr:hypothetical protein [Oscillospiraceae bacterium]